MFEVAAQTDGEMMLKMPRGGGCMGWSVGVSERGGSVGETVRRAPIQHMMNCERKVIEHVGNKKTRDAAFD